MFHVLLPHSHKEFGFSSALARWLRHHVPKTHPLSSRSKIWIHQLKSNTFQFIGCRVHVHMVKTMIVFRYLFNGLGWLFLPAITHTHKDMQDARENWNRAELDVNTLQFGGGIINKCVRVYIYIRRSLTALSYTSTSWRRSLTGQRHTSMCDHWPQFLSQVWKCNQHLL